MLVHVDQEVLRAGSDHFASLECELLDGYHFKSQSEGRLAVFRHIEGWYSRHRRHSALDYQSPVKYEGMDLAA